jgi:glycosyltransferase involved in cell wall biosynthesis
MKRFAIDLLWVRPNKVGGTEFYIRNILDGMLDLNDNFECILIVSKDNVETFSKYEKDKRFFCLVCNIKSANVIKRIMWQNFFLERLLLKHDILVCYEPVYSKPFISNKQIKYFTTIHDLQALHYPKYQSKLKVLWLRLSWWNTVRTSEKVIAISNFVRDDILKRYKVDPERVVTIYNAVVIDSDNLLPFEIIENKYDIKSGAYFYTVSSMAPHKNLITIIRIILKIKNENLELPRKLVITGIGGGDKQKILSLIKEMNLCENIVLTGFIDKAERNTLYKNCHTFLFPSVFEGFGMPPVEAILLGKHVLTTRLTSIPEVTENVCEYVENPYDEKEWIRKILSINIAISNERSIDSYKYSLDYIARQYLETFGRTIN